MEKWDFNPFILEDSEKHEIIWTIFHNLDLFSKYKIDGEKFKSLLSAAHMLYTVNKNPFHNYNHAINVAHCVYYFITKTSFMKQ